MASRIQIERILCPTDFSVFAERALRHAEALARRFHAQLRVLNVIPQWQPYGIGDPLYALPITVNPILRTRAEDDVRAFARSALAGGIPVDTMVLEGDPWREIVSIAHESSADLIVMGTHGRTGFEQLLLGAVTETVLRRAPCPILTVCHEEGRTWESPGLISRIVCATDLSESSQPTLRYALAMAEEHQASLTLLHVIECIHGEVDPRYRDLPETAQWRQNLEQTARMQLQAAIPDTVSARCQVGRRLEFGSAHREILRVAVAEKADLIVMGVGQQGALSRTVFGSTSEHVVREATCPVLTVRPIAHRNARATAPAKVTALAMSHA